MCLPKKKFTASFLLDQTNPSIDDLNVWQGLVAVGADVTAKRK